MVMDYHILARFDGSFIFSFVELHPTVRDPHSMLELSFGKCWWRLDATCGQKQVPIYMDVLNFFIIIVVPLVTTHSCCNH